MHYKGIKMGSRVLVLEEFTMLGGLLLAAQFLILGFFAQNLLLGQTDFFILTTLHNTPVIFRI